MTAPVAPPLVGARDARRRLRGLTAELAAADERTLRSVLREPYAFVLETLAKPGGPVPFVMPRG